MIEIKSVKASVDNTNPSIDVQLTIDLPMSSLLLDVRGVVHTEDKKIIGILQRIPWNAGSLPQEDHLQMNRVNEYNFSRNENPRFLEFILYLSNKSIDHLEETREKNKKKDIVLNIEIQYESVSSELLVSDFDAINYPKMNLNQKLISIREEKGARGMVDLIIPGNSNSLLMRKTETQTVTHNIAASDWIHDYQEPLGIGKSIIFEFPDLQNVKDEIIVFPQEKEILRKRLKATLDKINDMKENMKSGEWGEVVKGSVEVYELIKKDNQTLIKNIISESNGLSEEESTKLTSALDGLYGYSAGLHHPINKTTKDTKNPFIGNKEDAYLAYSLSVSLVYLLSKKLERSIT